MPLFEESDLEGKRRIEVSPAVLYNSQKLCHRILEQGGSSLIIDYGHEGTKEDTFRAFKSHKLVRCVLGFDSKDLMEKISIIYHSIWNLS